MSSREDLRQAEKVFMEDLQRQAGAFEPKRAGDTFMYAGHVAGDMIIIGELSAESALEFLRSRRAKRQVTK